MNISRSYRWSDLHIGRSSHCFSNCHFWLGFSLQVLEKHICLFLFLLGEEFIISLALNLVWLNGVSYLLWWVLLITLIVLVACIVKAFLWINRIVLLLYWHDLLRVLLIKWNSLVVLIDATIQSWLFCNALILKINIEISLFIFILLLLEDAKLFHLELFLCTYQVLDNFLIDNAFWTACFHEIRYPRHVFPVWMLDV